MTLTFVYLSDYSIVKLSGYKILPLEVHSMIVTFIILLALLLLFPEVFGALLAGVLIALRFLIGIMVWIIALGALALVVMT